MCRGLNKYENGETSNELAKGDANLEQFDAGDLRPIGREERPAVAASWWSLSTPNGMNIRGNLPDGRSRCGQVADVGLYPYIDHDCMNARVSIPAYGRYNSPSSRTSNCQPLCLPV